MSGEWAASFDAEVVMRPPFGRWHTVEGTGLQVMCQATDTPGTIHLRKAPGPEGLLHLGGPLNGQYLVPPDTPREGDRVTYVVPDTFRPPPSLAHTEAVVTQFRQAVYRCETMAMPRVGSRHLMIHTGTTLQSALELLREHLLRQWLTMPS